MMKKKFILFLTGAYKPKDLKFYRGLLKGKTTIAVDGGFEFFKKIKTDPNFIIGDMDSVKLPKKIPASLKVMLLPSKKDFTDSQKALEFCLENNADEIEMVMPGVGEVDHFIGNIMLLCKSKIIKWAKDGGKLKIINPGYDLTLLVDNKTSFKNSKGKILSVIPLSSSIELTCTGLEYSVDGQKISRGDSVSLRNIITSQRAQVEVKGQALVYRSYGK